MESSWMVMYHAYRTFVAHSTFCTYRLPTGAWVLLVGIVCQMMFGIEIPDNLRRWQNWVLAKESLTDEVGKRERSYFAVLRKA